jgi:hypothetical protein
MMRFRRNENGSIEYQTDERSPGELGLRLSFDMGFAYDSCLDALRAVDDVLSGRSDSEGYEGNDYRVEVNKETATFTRSTGMAGLPPHARCPRSVRRSPIGSLSACRPPSQSHDRGGLRCIKDVGRGS